MSDPVLYALRHQVHQVLDPLWMEALENGGYREKKKAFLRSKGAREVQKVARERVYGWLAEQMWLTRRQCHATKFTAAQCHEAIQLLSNVTYIEIRAWARQRKLRMVPRPVVEARAC